MNKGEELQEAYNKLDAAEATAGRLRKEIAELLRIQEVIIAAGLLSKEKFDQARELVESFDQ